MIVVFKPNTSAKAIEDLSKSISAMGVQVNKVVGSEATVLGIVGDTSNVDLKILEANENVERVMRVSEPYKKANRKFHPDPTIVQVGDTQVGGKQITLIAGPCSVESRAQITDIAKAVKASGATMLRGGAFKPRTSPYAFQGLRYEGLDLLKEAKAATSLPIVTELMSPYDLDRFVQDVDVIQIGARNMQNFELLKELGKTDKPVLLKRGLSATIEEWLMSAEYILSGGNPNVILCERGIRTFEHYTRNTLDLSAVVVIKQVSHLPIVIDPSHATGKAWMVPALARAAIAVGADGLIIEVHNDPAHALCDGNQSIRPEQFDDVVKDLRTIAPVVGREIK